MLSAKNLYFSRENRDQNPETSQLVQKY